MAGVKVAGVKVAGVKVAGVKVAGSPTEPRLQSVNAPLGTTSRLAAATRAVTEQTAHTVR